MSPLPIRIGPFSRLAALAIASCLAAELGAQTVAPPATTDDTRQVVRIAGLEFDPAREEPKLAADLRAQPPATGPGWWLVQLRRSPSRADRARLAERFGLELDRYYPVRAYLERVDAERVAELSRDPLVRAVVAHQPAFKLSPAIGKVRFRTAERRAMGFRLLAVLFPGADPAAVATELRGLGATRVEIRDRRRREPATEGRLAFNLPGPAALPAVARIEGIRWIEEFPERDLDNGNTAGTIQSGVAGTTPVWNQGLHGEGQIVGVIDGGPLDVNHCHFEDPADNTPRPDHRKVLEIRSSAAAAGHGTFVAGVVAGDDFGNPGTGVNRGNAWAARLVSGLNSEDMDDALVDNMEQGAFVHTNSWHDDTGDPATYNQTAEDADTFTWDHEDHLVLGSMGNNGEEQGPPGTSKNAIGVNASQQDPNEGTFGDGNDGPTADGRRKPDITAPGCAINSSTVATACTTGPRAACATSYATPAVAAAAALVRQYYSEGWYPTGTEQPHHAFTPSGALLKATLLNGTLDMAGPAGYPSDTEGWGMIRLDDALFFAGDARNLRVWDVRNASGLATGETRDYAAAVAGNGQPLKVTLVWTEPPGSAGSATPVINDLDLVVVSPDGTQTFLGNQFGGGVSVTGGAADTLNNVEQVLINNPAVGDWTVRVAATTVDVGAPGQGYALVVTADLPEPPVSTGDQDTLVVRVALPDVLAGAAPGETTVQNLAADLAAYVAEVSYGRATVDPILFPDPLTLPHAKSYYFAPSRNPLVEMTQDVVDALLAADAAVFDRGTPDPADDVDRMILALNDPDFTGDWATTGPWPYDLPGGLTRPISVSIQTVYNDPDPRWAHGMGHQLGMVDLGAHPGVVFAQPHVDEWDNMARPFSRPHPMAWSKERAGWLTADGSAPVYVARPAAGASTAQTFDLDFLSDDTGPRAIAVGLTEGAATLGAEDVFYWIEARTNTAGGADDVLPEPGVLVYHVAENVPQGEGPVRILDDDLTTASLADAALEVGDGKSPAGTGLDVTVLAGTATADRRIQIAYDPPETDNDARIRVGDPSWVSPDIWVDSQRDGFDEDLGRVPQDRGDQAVEGEVNRLYFRIANPGPGKAFDFMVRVRVSEPYHTVGGQADFDRFVGEVHVDQLDEGSELVRYVEWIPDEDGNPHSCVEVVFPNVFNDVNPNNNRAQENLEEVTSSHGSPYEPVGYAFGLTNDRDHPQLYYFRTEGVPAGWTATLSPRSTLLLPGARVDGTLLVQPPDGAPDCTEHPIRLSSWRPSGDTLVPVGGGTFQVDLRSKTAVGLEAGLAACGGQPGVLLRSAAYDPSAKRCLQITASGCTTPPRPNEEIVVRYETPDGIPVYHTVTTDAAGCYSDFLVVPEGGPWEVTAEYPGGDCSGRADAGPVGVLVPLPETEDTDGDGLPDAEEPQGDPDHDGRPGFEDPDSDNDGVPDGQEPPGDCDRDGVPNVSDPDSDGDGTPDRSDLSPCGDGGGVLRGRLFASFHVGSAHPLGRLDGHAEANVYAAVDAGWRLTDRLQAAGTLGVAQFTEEIAAAGDHERIAHLSANLRALFATTTPLTLYVEAGPGLYRGRSGGTRGGFDLGLGAIHPVAPSLALAWGANYHQVASDERERFLTFHLGVHFR